MNKLTDEDKFAIGSHLVDLYWEFLETDRKSPHDKQTFAEFMIWLEGKLAKEEWNIKLQNEVDKL